MRRSAERNACSFLRRSARCPRIWYWRERARIAVCAALRSVVTRVGRSSSVTLPSVRHASAESGESAPGRVRISTGRSDHGGWSVSHSASGALCSAARCSSATRTVAAPSLSAATSASMEVNAAVSIPAPLSSSAVIPPSLAVGAIIRIRKSRAEAFIVAAHHPSAGRPSLHRRALRSARRGNSAGDRRRECARRSLQIRGSCVRARRHAS